MAIFRVSDIRALIDSKLTISINNPTVWLHLVPIKCISFVWRACMGRIPTTVALSKRGNCPKKRKIFIAICYGLLWCMSRTTFGLT
uniref:Reverse transcriptase zinc-binding domain-containing protein n=1 Tax=Lactuca sativa TaxID=4236 RepID=A0A9R1UFJ8_LACSA|nr:hypothetical protein LSAT_V11C900482370 [Lactuca sativa]